MSGRGDRPDRVLAGGQKRGGGRWENERRKEKMHAPWWMPFNVSLCPLEDRRATILPSPVCKRGEQAESAPQRRRRLVDAQLRAHVRLCMCVSSSSLSNAIVVYLCVFQRKRTQRPSRRRSPTAQSPSPIEIRRTGCFFRRLLGSRHDRARSLSQLIEQSTPRVRACDLCRCLIYLDLTTRRLA